MAHPRQMDENNLVFQKFLISEQPSSFTNPPSVQESTAAKVSSGSSPSSSGTAAGVVEKQPERPSHQDTNH